MECLKKAAADPEIQTLVIDTFTRLNLNMIDHIVHKPIPGIPPGGAMTLPRWGELASEWTRFLTHLKTTGKNLIGIVHESWEKDEVTGILKPFPSIQGGTKQMIQSYFSDFWRTTVEGEGDKAKYFVNTAPSGRITCKTSLPGIPAKFEFKWDLVAPFFEQPATLAVKEGGAA